MNYQKSNHFKREYLALLWLNSLNALSHQAIIAQRALDTRYTHSQLIFSVRGKNGAPSKTAKKPRISNPKLSPRMRGLKKNGCPMQFISFLLLFAYLIESDDVHTSHEHLYTPVCATAVMSACSCTAVTLLSSHLPTDKRVFIQRPNDIIYSKQQ